jgi:hypothetical protein
MGNLIKSFLPHDNMKNLDGKKNFTELELVQSIESMFPTMPKEFEIMAGKGEIIIYQGDYARDYKLTELLQLGMIIKFAGINEVDLKVVFAKPKKNGKKK